jgi:hypothetical protein
VTGTHKHGHVQNYCLYFMLSLSVHKRH